MTDRPGTVSEESVGAPSVVNAAESRREQILQAAIRVFASKGYWRATTADIASECGISQPYVYRFFPRKETLFVAALERSVAVVLQGFDVVAVRPSQLVPAMTAAYRDMTRVHRHEILLQMQAQVIDEPVIRDAVRDAIGRMHDLVLARFVLAHCADAERAARQFMAEAMLCNVAAMLELPLLAAPVGDAIPPRPRSGGSP